MNRREFNRLLTAGAVAGIIPTTSLGLSSAKLNYNIPQKGHVRLLHITDCHAQLNPVYFREPNVNIGLKEAFGRTPHVVGDAFLSKNKFSKNSIEAHAFTYLNFDCAAKEYGKVGGFAHLSTLIASLRASAGGASNSLLLDGGDTWQGSATAYWSRGKDMVKAANLLGVDVMTGHWEFTYQDEEVFSNVDDFNGDFLAQNIKLTEDALFEGKRAHDESTGRVFKPYTIKELNGMRVAIIGQAFPYTPVANPKRFIPDWSFGIQNQGLQELVGEIKETEKPAAIILLSHNGMDVDLKLASVVTGIDFILGGHTHDGVPIPVTIKNSSGVTVVTNAGSNGKFLGVLDLNLSGGKLKGYEYRLLPVFSNFIKADAEMSALIEDIRKPHLDTLTEELAISETLLYRRGNFNGTFDQLICDALRHELNAEISLSPGFRWGTTVLAGQAITFEHVMDQTCITYPETYARNMLGNEIKSILEDVADNLFHPDPFYQQGGDMVRVGGMNYICDPTAPANKRISNMTLDNGRLIEPNKYYKVAGWATVGSKAPGKPVWEIVSSYLRNRKTVAISHINSPKLKNVGNNLGVVL
ncbi:MAG: thiosulfohydrolase SoxB [Cycloclasticus sp. symbiont of Poecilosclerida sp. N]|nr:MAG: thiosulfohydrolase SoxB [Cycloclasticus sp. symbiont of Poecilosclerida sp. N]